MSCDRWDSYGAAHGEWQLFAPDSPDLQDIHQFEKNSSLKESLCYKHFLGKIKKCMNSYILEALLHAQVHYIGTIISLDNVYV